MYSLPEHVLAPPKIEIDGELSEHMDQNLYNELVATNAYLAQQQRALQQQLLTIQAATQQFGGLSLGGSMTAVGQQYQSPVSPTMNFYNQQFQQGMQPIVQPVSNSPGVFAVYNPMTGQSSFVVDNAFQAHDTTSMSHQEPVQSPLARHPGANRQQQFSPPLETSISPSTSRARSPPKSTPSPPQDVEPLPPPSANAFRRGHKKSLSSNTGFRNNNEAPKTGTPRSAGYPQTPMTGTFGPGQARAGEHPIRQPRGPPLLQELEDKPTSKYEGSKNFATRQRRRAVHDLVRAGRERASETRQPGSGSGTPGSEGEFTFSVSSDNDDAAASSGSLSSKPSIGSLRAAANGAIGSERKDKSRERSSIDSAEVSSATSLSSDEGFPAGGKFIEVESSWRKTPMLVLSSAEKRKSAALWFSGGERALGRGNGEIRNAHGQRLWAKRPTTASHSFVNDSNITKLHSSQRRQSLTINGIYWLLEKGWKENVSFISMCQSSTMHIMQRGPLIQFLTFERPIASGPALSSAIAAATYVTCS
jgi:hypothetical protein